MKEAIVNPGGKVDIIDSPIPSDIGENDVLIKVIVSGSNPKDWKIPDWQKKAHNPGDDIAGIVHKVGSKVTSFVPGQRVAAFHQITTPYGSFAEYAVAPAHTTFTIPQHTSFEEAASLPLAAATAAVGLFVHLGLPEPWTAGAEDGKRAKEFGPLIVYGGASAVGAYAIQYAKRAGIGPIFAVCGKGSKFVESLLDKSKGDAIIDYRDGDAAVVENLQKAAQAVGNPKLLYTYDAISDHNSYVNASKALADGGKVLTVLPGKDYSGVPENVKIVPMTVGCVHTTQRDFGQVCFSLMGKGLAEGWLKGHPTETIPGGLDGVAKGLMNMKEGRNSAVKYVFKITDTPGL